MALFALCLMQTLHAYPGLSCRALAFLHAIISSTYLPMHRVGRHAGTWAAACLQDEGADIDVSALLLPEPGQNCAEGPGAAGEQDRDPEEQLPAAAAGHTAAQPQTSVPASDAVFANHPEQNGMAAVAGPGIADEQDGDFGDQLAEASKVSHAPFVTCSHHRRDECMCTHAV